MEKRERELLIQLSKTEWWKVLKKMSQAHISKLWASMWDLDLEDKSNKELFKDRRNYVNAFNNLIEMVEWKVKEEDILKKLELESKEDEDFITPLDLAWQES